MTRPTSETAALRRSVQRHYDSLAFLYRTFWGQHIHHGLWKAADDAPRDAQLHLVEYLAGCAGVPRGARVLDVGCGFGASARWLAASLDCQVTGVTISRRQGRRARRQQVGGSRSGPLEVVRADAAVLPFRDNTFDLVWVIECIEHLEDKSRFFGRVARLLRPGGRLALCSWQRGPGVSEDEPLVREVCEAFICPSLAEPDEYRRWCRDSGLAVERMEDLTQRVQRTWDVLIRRVNNPWLAPLRPLLGPETRRFLDGFPVIARAYASGAMSYGLLVAARR